MEAVNPLMGTLTARVPPDILPRLMAVRDVVSVRPAPPRPVPLLYHPTDAIGAATWWADGYTGGTGSADVTALAGSDAPDLVIEDNDRIDQDHPGFAGLRFESPAGAPPTCPDLTASTCAHPSEVLSFAVGQSVSSCPVAPGYACNSGQDIDAGLEGVAPGADKVLDPQDIGYAGDYYNGLAWALGIPQIGTRYRHPLAGATDPAEVDNMSLGIPSAGIDDTSWDQQDDAVISGFGLLKTGACGNDGPAPGSVNSPGDAYDELCVGAFNPGSDLSDPSDDTIYSWSSVGPTPAGRKKPDLVADGGGPGANPTWKTTSSLWNGITGTSFAAPQVAGGALLLEGAGISDPLAVRAILIDSARSGRATPASAMGTQTGWQADWGWGELDLTAAYGQRTNFYTAAITGNGVHFYAANTMAAGDRATLTWNRRVSTDWPTGQSFGPWPLSDLNLYEYDRGSGAQRVSSESGIDNVEQIRSPGAASVIYKVTAGPVSGVGAEPYALAATRQVTPLVSPQPTVSIDASRSVLAPGQTATVTATATNPSDTLTASAPTLDLAPPAGVRIVTALDPAPSAPLGPGQSVTRRWTVEGVAESVEPTVATSTGQAYGSTLTGSARTTVRVDLTGPAAALTVPGAPAAGVPAIVRWSATDPSGVQSWTVERSVDGGPYAVWAGPTTATEAAFVPEAGHTYRFRARAVDQLGNVGPWTESALVSVPSPRPADDAHPPARPGRADPRLAIRTVHWVAGGRRAVVRLAFATAARGGRLRLELTVRRGRRSRTVGSPWIVARGSGASVGLRLPGGRWSAASARVRYLGSSGAAPATLVQRLRLPARVLSRSARPRR